MTYTQLKRIRQSIYVAACEKCTARNHKARVADMGEEHASYLPNQMPFAAKQCMDDCPACLDIFARAVLAAADEPCAHC